MNKTLLAALTVSLLTIFGSSQAYANHAWGKYHWDLSTETTLVTPLKIGNNLSSQWQTSLEGASTDWNDTRSPLRNEIVLGTSNDNCDPTINQVEVCNGDYGDNGWLGIAQVWAYRGKDAHIAQGVVKLNDAYFSTPAYDTQPWRNMVTCQEIGHTFGLGHQDEQFDNPNMDTCMDYTNNPTSNQQPNQHDYDMLTSIYAHLNTTSGGGGSNGGGGKGRKPQKASAIGMLKSTNDAESWGAAIKQDARGKNSLYEKDLGNGLILITHVTWTL